MDLKFGYNSTLFPQNTSINITTHCTMVNGKKRQRFFFNSPEFKCSYSGYVAVHVEGSDFRRNNYTRHKARYYLLQLGYSYTSRILGAYCMTASHTDIVNYLVGNCFKLILDIHCLFPESQLPDLHNPSWSHRPRPDTRTWIFIQQDLLDPWSPTGYISWRNQWRLENRKR